MSPTWPIDIWSEPVAGRAVATQQLRKSRSDHPVSCEHTSAIWEQWPLLASEIPIRIPLLELRQGSLARSMHARPVEAVPQRKERQERSVSDDMS